MGNESDGRPESSEGLIVPPLVGSFSPKSHRVLLLGASHGPSRHRACPLTAALFWGSSRKAWSPSSRSHGLSGAGGAGGISPPLLGPGVGGLPSGQGGGGGMENEPGRDRETKETEPGVSAEVKAC